MKKDSFHLIDIIDLINPSLKKCCHEQIRGELSVHNIDAFNWLEIKDNLLIKYINICTYSKVYKFCSDDQNARFSILAYSSNNDFDIRCYSPFSLFYIANKNQLINKEILKHLFDSWKLTCFGSQNIQIVKKISKSGESLYERVTPDFLYDNIIDGKMVLLRDGYLCYLSAIQETENAN